MNLKDPSKSTLIDIILTKTPYKYSVSGALPLDKSDHCLIIGTKDTYLPKSNFCTAVKIHFWNFNLIVFYLTFYTVTSLSYMFEIQEAEAALNHFMNTFNSVVKKHALFKTLRLKDRSSPRFIS